MWNTLLLRTANPVWELYYGRLTQGQGGVDITMHGLCMNSWRTPVSKEQGCSLIFNEATDSYKIQQGLVGISLPSEVCPLTRASRAPNAFLFRHIQSNCNVYKYSFYPSSIVPWNTTICIQPWSVNVFLRRFTFQTRQFPRQLYRLDQWKCFVWTTKLWMFVKGM